MIYSGNEHLLYVEAIRTVPGMLAVMETSRPLDGRALVSGYFAEGRRLGVSYQSCWSILFTAAMHWMGNLVGQLAEHVEIDPLACAQQMGRLAMQWESQGCPDRA